MTKIRLYDHVKRMLEDSPMLRDSDRKLIWRVWSDLGFVTGRAIIYEDFMKAPLPETIRRIRQKIQEKHPNLRSSQSVMEAKIDKQYEKGTFIYREQIPLI